MKALIPAAGHGTRFLPVTRVVPKEMLPVGSKPAIHLIVEEALAAGADEVVIVSSPEKEIIRRYFDGDPALAARIRWACQTEQKGLGHAVLQGAPLLADEKDPILVLLGDALVSGEAPSAAMAAISRAHGNASVVGLEEVPLEKVSRYGIVSGTVLKDLNDFKDLNDLKDFKDLGERVWNLDDLVEKPAPEKAPSRLAIAGRYLLDPAIFGLLATQPPGHGGEIQLTDAIRCLLADKPVYGYRYPGRRHDIGNPAGYLETLKAFA
ncbi:MAG: NTP transferase domain-containing protein [Kiritimatiellae bacterium]|nr:NTP transferase domain-containing protein [Kiritimatiellia bacterium]